MGEIKRTENILIYIFLFAMLLLISAFDIYDKVVPEGLSLLGILGVLNYQLYHGNIHLSVVGLTVGVFSVWALNQMRFMKLGGGDAKVMGLIGSCLGWEISIATLGLSIVLYFLFFRKKLRNIAYVPVITWAFMGVWICQVVRYFFRI